MKKVIFVALATLGVFFMNAQDEEMGGQTSQGNWLVEINTGLGSAGYAVGSTSSFGFSSQGKNNYINLGVEGGYFVADNFVAKAGLGYASSDETITDLSGNETKVESNGFSYMLGSKYYITGKFPVQLALRGTSVKDAKENPLWLGLSGGYAWFLSDHLALEPSLAYNFSLNQDYSKDGVFELKIGFAAFF